MVPREEVLWRLAHCLSIQTSTPIYLDHQREALARYGLSEQAQAELDLGVRRLTEAALDHAASLARLRESLLGGKGDV